MRNTLAVILLLLTATAANAASVKDDIDRFVAQVVKEIPDVTSIGIAVVRDGKPYFAAAYGYADAEKKTRADAKTGYYIASSTKSYTGLACAILAGRGVLDLDAPISKYLPEVTSDAGKVTLRQFLTHTAPIENDPIVFRTAFTGEHTPALLTQLLNSSKPRKEGFQYDNLGYVVASLVIERVTASRGSACSTSWSSRPSAWTTRPRTCPRRESGRWQRRTTSTARRRSCGWSSSRTIR